MNLLSAALVSLLGFAPIFAAPDHSPKKPRVAKMRVPQGGIQPQAAVDSSGGVHLVYFVGDPAGGDLYYQRRDPEAQEFSAPIRINRRENASIAIGTIRGPRLALDGKGRPQIVWNGTAPGDAAPAPLCYTRLNPQGDGFEPEIDLLDGAGGLDGGSAVAADDSGRVAVLWHAPPPDGGHGELSRTLYLRLSNDYGATFEPKKEIIPDRRGVCPCCGMTASLGDSGRLTVLYRAATTLTDRAMVALSSEPPYDRFNRSLRHPWEIGACPMSSASARESDHGVLAAWETAGDVFFSELHAGSASSARLRNPTTPPPKDGRKHPVAVANPEGDVLLAWIEGAGWNRGGRLMWQLFKDGEAGSAPAAGGQVAVWSFASAVALPSGDFLLFY